MLEGKLEKRIGKNIQSIRKAQKITQEELGDKIGAIKQTVSKIERGVYSPPLKMLYDICEVLSANPNEILYRDSEWQEWREESVLKTNYSLKGLDDKINILEDLWAKVELYRQEGKVKQEEIELDSIIQICLQREHLQFYSEKVLPNMASNQSLIELLREYANTAYKSYLNAYLDKVIAEVRENKIYNLKQAKKS